jgi:hypothetical protein
MSKQSYCVELEVLTSHTFTIYNVNSPEEAEQDAKDQFENGDAGEIDEDFDYISVDVYPADDEEEI